MALTPGAAIVGAAIGVVVEQSLRNRSVINFFNWSESMKIKQAKLLAAAVATLGALLAMPAHAGKTLDGIKARGQVVCGVNTGLAGFAFASAMALSMA